TPLHPLLAREVGRPFVLTSGNVSDEPIAYDDDDATATLSGIADAFLRHDRPIRTRTDDSVVRVFRGRVLPVRRSRGFAPEPLPVHEPFPRPVLACGAELKSTFCLGKGRHAFVSHHIGDLENYETLRSFTEGVAHYQALFDVRPEVVVHDLHPEYLSTKYAVDRGDRDEVRLVGVQHHHAHIASCMADNGTADPVVGVAFDGLGLGTDGTLWGGEILAADLAGFHRLGHLEPVPMPGGAAAIRQPWRMALSWLTTAYDGQPPPGLAVARRHERAWGPVRELARSGVGSPLTSSVGRLFDAVAALLDVRDAITYEGQAAVELEQLAAPGPTAGYPPALDGLVIRGSALVRAVVEDVRSGADRALVAARFHDGLALATAEAAARACEATGRSTVALSGGVFQNVRLLGRLVAELERRGLRVLVHGRVPPNDGGISLGQAVVAGARDRVGA
ncbi:MAG TPA: Sua5/YciO/YrdC/YwlC family protein, partial [Candidatus Eisenbacteria bacterium]|nr:Sua5/YciO/YrdC/YwlC family protein [Candidatus Eisenbacteria bacterium]